MATGHGPELVMIRHAPSAAGGRLVGRTDVAADAGGLAAAARLRGRLAEVAYRVSSPALRCRQTASALWPDEETDVDPRLWEQDFGAWEGRPLDEVPDLGPLSGTELARNRPPQGESFADVCDRIRPALAALAERGETVAVVAHAGTVRAALAAALGDPAPALAFEIAPLSITRFRPVAGGFAVICVNCVPG